MRHIVSASYDPVEPGQTSRHVLASENLGTDRCEIALLHLGEHAVDGDEQGPSEERFVFVLSGTVQVKSASEMETLNAHSFVFLPRGRPHRIGSLGGLSATLLDIRAFVPDARQNAPAQGKALAQLTGQIAAEAFSAHHAHLAEGSAFDTQALADRRLGAERLKVFAAAVPPGSGMGLHIHPFDQFYFILEGALDVQVGLESGRVAAGQLVAFPAGTVHRNRNDGVARALQITINVPEQAQGQVSAFDVVLSEIKR
jgi:mannose-6-phosphate isomerase-like protein (cupin superfamily)